MPKRRHWLWSGVLASVVVALGMMWWRDALGERVSEIKFELGKNIVETAEASGVPRFRTRDIAGLVSYSVNNIPSHLPLRYAKQGYEVTWQPVFAFTMYADRDIHPDLKTEKIRLTLDSSGMQDAQAQAFVEATIAQFQKGKWQRYADPDYEVMLTGRSSILDEQGNLASVFAAIDPNYKLSPDDWTLVARRSSIWRWVGDGVIAQLSVHNSVGEDGKDSYDMDLEFELLDVKLKRLADGLVQDLKDGDAKGWNSTAEHKATKIKVQALNQRLIANAIKRGDGLYVAPQR